MTYLPSLLFLIYAVQRLDQNIRSRIQSLRIAQRNRRELVFFPHQPLPALLFTELSATAQELLVLITQTGTASIFGNYDLDAILGELFCGRKQINQLIIDEDKTRSRMSQDVCDLSRCETSIDSTDNSACSENTMVGLYFITYIKSEECLNVIAKLI